MLALCPEESEPKKECHFMKKEVANHERLFTKNGECHDPTILPYGSFFINSCFLHSPTLFLIKLDAIVLVLDVLGLRWYILYNTKILRRIGKTKPNFFN